MTRDGLRVHLHANIEMPAEIESVLASGAEGIGLLRSEFMFMNRDRLPGEEEQFKELAPRRPAHERPAGDHPHPRRRRRQARRRLRHEARAESRRWAYAPFVFP